MPHRPVRRTFVLSIVAATLGTPAPASATPIPTRPTPLTLVDAPAATGCPTAAQVSGTDLTAVMRRLAAKPIASASVGSGAFEALAHALYAAPAPLISVCEPALARAGRPLGSILGDAAVLPWSDAVAAGRRQLGVSRISVASAAHPGDRFVLPAGLASDAAVDVAVATTTGVRTVRPTMPPGAPATVSIDGTLAGPVVVVTDVAGATTRTAPATPPAALAMTARAGTPTRHDTAIAFSVKTSPGAIVVGLRAGPFLDPNTGKNQLEPMDNGAPAVAVASAKGLAFPTVSGITDETTVIDLVAVDPDQRVFAGVRCKLVATGPAKHRRPTARCKRDDAGPLASWFGRAKGWITSEQRGAVDREIGTATPPPVYDETTASAVAERLRRIASHDMPQPYIAALTPPRASVPIVAAPRTVRAPRAAAARRDGSVPAPNVPARATVISAIGGVSAAAFQRVLKDGSDGLEAGDVNGDGRPDFLVGSEVPSLWMSAPGGTYKQVEFENGGDGGTLSPDLDGDGTAELVDALGVVVLGQRAWATATPAKVGQGTSGGGPGQFPTNGDANESAEFVPLSDVTGDGRPELLQLGVDVRAVIASQDLQPGSTTRVAELLRTPASYVLDPIISGLQNANASSYLDRIPGTPQITAADAQRAAILTSYVPKYPPYDHDFQPNTTGKVSWQVVDPAQPLGLGPVSASIPISSTIRLLDSDGPTGDLLIAAALGTTCQSDTTDCFSVSRVTRTGEIEATFDVPAFDSEGCQFVDDGPDADTAADVICSVQASLIPEAFSSSSLVADALVLASSTLRGKVTTAELPHLAIGGTPIVATGGIEPMIDAAGHRTVSTISITGRGRKARGSLVVIDGAGA